MDIVLLIIVINFVWTVINVYMTSHLNNVLAPEKLTTVWVVSLKLKFGKSKIFGIYADHDEAHDVAMGAAMNGVGDKVVLTSWNVLTQETSDTEMVQGDDV